MNVAAPTLLIRADASSTLGAGHVMRALALAQAAADAGAGAAFVLAERTAPVEALLAAQGVDVLHVDAEAGSRADALALCALARARRAAVVLDGYQFDAAYQEQIKGGGLYLCCIDDYAHAARYVADLVVNQDLGYADPARYAGRAASARLLLGASYALIRREFRTARPAAVATAEAARRILVTMGGSDAGNLTQRVLDELETLAGENLEVTAIVGGANRHGAALDAARGRSRLRLRLVQNAPDMPAWMGGTDLAVSAGGMTSYELAYMGVPAVLVAAADTQAPSSRILHEAGICHFAGRADEVKPGALAEAVRALAAAPARRHAMAMRGRKMFDGDGARRVLEAIAAAAPGGFGR